MNKKENQRVRLTKKLFQNSLASLMKEKPFYQITVSDICLRSELNRSTFYKHYSNVYDILLELETELIDSAKKCISEIDTRSMNTATQPLAKLLEYIKENKETYLLLFNQHIDENFRSSLMKITIKLITDKLEIPIDEDSNDCKMVYIMNGSVALIQQWLENGTNRTVEDVAGTILKYSSAVFDV